MHENSNDDHNLTVNTNNSEYAASETPASDTANTENKIEKKDGKKKLLPSQDIATTTLGVIAVPDAIQKQYIRVGDKFYFRDNANKFAFGDDGNKLLTNSNEARVASSMVLYVEAKGWKEIKVSGHADFRREIWMQASLRGINVVGYKPNELDIAKRNERYKTDLKNEIKAVDKSDSSVSKRSNVTPLRNKTHTGVILDHGNAPYENKAENKPSYFITLQTSNGDKTYWGIDVKRALSESGAAKGDSVNLGFEGNKAVTVMVDIKDKTGKITGHEEKTVHRNSWKIEKSDEAKIIEAVAAAVITEKASNPELQQKLITEVQQRLEDWEKQGQKLPNIAMYDKGAPREDNRGGQQAHFSNERTR